MIDEIASASGALGSFKTQLEDRAEAALARIENERIELSRRAHALSEVLRNVRVARAEGATYRLDAAMRRLQSYMAEAGSL